MAGILSVIFASSGGAAVDENRVRQLERKVNILTEEVTKLRLGEVGSAPLQVKTGLGPKASKIYSTQGGFSLAGYGEMIYDNYSKTTDGGALSGKTNTIDYLRQVLYFGYKFSDSILLNSEIEFEHASTGSGGEVSVEFAYLDFLTHSPVNYRSGMVLIPVGIYNEIHEPPTFFSTRRPEVEQRLIPTTWRANGVGIFGDLGETISYKLYLTESLNAVSFGGASIRGGRQKGAQAKAEDIALSGRLDYQLAPGSLIGASFFTGGTAQAQIVGTDGKLTVWDLHARFKSGPLELRGLYVQNQLSGANFININNSLTGANAMASGQTGYYFEAGYDVMPMFVKASSAGLIPFVRYEKLNLHDQMPAGYTANSANDRTYLVYGVSFLPDPNVALKFDYQDEKKADDSGVNSFRFASTFMF